MVDHEIVPNINNFIYNFSRGQKLCFLQKKKRQRAAMKQKPFAFTTGNTSLRISTFHPMETERNDQSP